ncbi:MAG: hypothetical protein ACP5E5_08770 [Acidobacteriaceae bacterium]
MQVDGRRRLIDLAAALLLAQAAATSIERLMVERRDKLGFDDAFMFLRYAHNIRHGLGFSWNLDGVHTYGPTSLLWSFCVLLLSYLPTDARTQLLLGSWVCSLAAVIAMAWAVTANAQSIWLRRMLPTLALIAAPLFASRLFQGDQFNGMETMPATALCALFFGLCLLWRAGRVGPALVGGVGVLLFLARPESGLVTLLLPALISRLPGGLRARAEIRRAGNLDKENFDQKNGHPPQPGLRSLLVLYGVFCAGVLAQLALCRLYFGTPAPLSVHMKGISAYPGYADVWYPSLMLIAFLGALQLFVAALVMLVRRRDLRLILSGLVPAALVFAYLGTVTQIMGFDSRYYVPYAPLLIIPAVLVLDRWLALPQAERDAWPGHTLRNRGAATAALLVLLFLFHSQAVQRGYRLLEHGHHVEYDPARLRIAATAPLPSYEWQPMMLAITDDLVAPLPSGVTVAATEVGYLGERASQANIIDMAGLNDPQIALHGFQVASFLKRKPDLIWMPNTSYTYQRGALFSDPDFLAQYDVHAGAGNYGIAIRKDSPFRAAIQRQFQIFWAAVYPGFNPSSYLVRSVTWSGRQQRVRDR